MSHDWSGGDSPESDPHPAQPAFDRSPLTLVCKATAGDIRWELYDGPYPLAQAPDAVGESLVYRSSSGGGGGGDSVGPRLAPDRIANVGSASFHDRHGSVGFITARCRPDVAAADCVSDDGSAIRLAATASSATGQHWIVWHLDRAAAAVRMDLLSADGDVLDSQPVSDPRGGDTQW